jgi:hypothetical protein
MSTSVAERAPVSSPALRFLIRNFVVYNPLFLFGAMLVLGGAWLINPPAPGNERDLSLLLQLAGVIQLYEFTLLGAAALLVRYGLTRDVRNLTVVLAPFCLDVTFTTSSLAGLVLTQAESWAAVHAYSALFLGIGVPLLYLKLRWASALTGRSFSAGQQAALLAGPLLVLAVPLLSAYLPIFGLGAEVGLVSGLGLAAVALLYAWQAGDRGSAANVARLAPLAMVGAGIHAASNAWAYASPLAFVVGPLLIALGPALPRLAWRHAADRDAITPFVLPILGALVLGIPGEQGFGLGGWHLGLIGMAAVHAVFLARTRAPWFLAGVVVAAHFAWGGATPAASLAAVGSNPMEPVVVLGLFVYALHRRAHPAVIAVPLLLMTYGVGALAPLGNPVDAVLALDVLGLGILVASHVLHGRGVAGARYRFVGTFLLVVPVTALALAADGGALGDLARAVSRATLAALLVPAFFTRLRVYALPPLLLPLETAVGLAPGSTVGWGAAALAGGFAVVSAGAALAIHRERILAWLERAEVADAKQGRPLLLRRPLTQEEWLGRVALAGGLCLATGWVVVPALGGGL